MRTLLSVVCTVVLGVMVQAQGSVPALGRASDRAQRQWEGSQAEVALDSNRVYTAVQQMPEYHGPKLSSSCDPVSDSTCLRGPVNVQFIVEPDGRVTDLKVLRSHCPAWDDAALCRLRQMKRWEPGLQNGKPVRVRMDMSFSFDQ